MDVVAVGVAAIDLVVEVDHLPGHDEKVNGRLVGRLPGGTVPNFACAASRLGLAVGFLGSVGDDRAGHLILEDFRHYGVDTRRVRVRTGWDTNMTAIFLDATGEKALVVIPTYEERLTLDESTRTYIAQARAVYTMNLRPDEFLPLAEIARASGARVVIDVEPTVFEDVGVLKEVLTSTDIVFCNRQGLEAAFGRAEEAAAREVLNFGPQLVVVTLGHEGSLAVSREESVRHPGFVVEVADTTGAGDCFNAAFLAGHLWGWSLRESSRFANAAAALSVTRVGPRGWLPTVEEVRAFLADRKRCRQLPGASSRRAP